MTLPDRSNIPTEEGMVRLPAKTVTHMLIAGVICFALLLAALFAFRLEITPNQLRFEPPATTVPR